MAGIGGGDCSFLSLGLSSRGGAAVPDLELEEAKAGSWGEWKTAAEGAMWLKGQCNARAPHLSQLKGQCAGATSTAAEGTMR